MIGDSLFIQLVDHRVSTALIFFLLMVLLNNRKPKQKFGLRALAAFVAMCAVSWTLRTVIDVGIASEIVQGLEYGVYTIAMSLMFLFGYSLCYYTTPGELLYIDLLALTIVKMAWNFFKAGSYAADLFGMPTVWSRYSVTGSLVSYFVYAIICVASCRIMGVAIGDVEDLSPTQMAPTFFVFLSCQAALDFCGHVFTADSKGLFLYYVCAMAYTATNYSVLRLVALRAREQRDNDNMRAFINNKIHYYQVSHDGIVSLQVKCHDLKHQIKAIRSQIGKENFEKYLDRLQDSIDEYGTVVDCGNEAINVVLTEKNILCTNCGVKFSYIIDGTLFDFMSDMEIYSLFGNVLDNALESCGKVSDPERRVISLKAVSQGEMVVLHVENFFEEELVMVDGMPVTTKSGAGHGFGLRSIREIAEKYGGVVTLNTEGNIFKLTVLMKRQ